MKFEITIWQFVNKRRIKKLKKKDLENSNIFIFGYKFSNDFFDYLIKNSFKNKIFIHLSHYHLFSINKKYFSRLNLSISDTDVKVTNSLNLSFQNIKKI